MVVASRYVRGGSRRGLDGAARRLVSRVAGAVARALFTEARASTDPLSGFFLCRRRRHRRHRVPARGIQDPPRAAGLRARAAGPRRPPRLRRPRRAGPARPSVRQGLLFLGHIRSLVFEVQGSARPWKFGLVGRQRTGHPPAPDRLLTAGRTSPRLAAFLLAYPPSLVWNTVLNRALDVRRPAPRPRRGHRPLPRARRSSPGAGHVRRLRRPASPLAPPPCSPPPGGALVAMAGQRRHQPRRGAAPARGCGARWRSTRASRPRWRGSPPRSAQTAPTLLPAAGPHRQALPAGHLERAVGQRRGVLFTEAAGHRAQRRSNIEVSSTLRRPGRRRRHGARRCWSASGCAPPLRRRPARRGHDGRAGARRAHRRRRRQPRGPTRLRGRRARRPDGPHGAAGRRSCGGAPAPPPAGARSPPPLLAALAAPTSAGRVIRVGALFPLTGPQSTLARQEYQGVEIARDMVNMDGGVRRGPGAARLPRARRPGRRPRPPCRACAATVFRS